MSCAMGGIMIRADKFSLIAASLAGLLAFPGPAHAGGTFSVLYTFLGQDDGEFPEAGMITDGQGELFGTTFGALTSGAPGKKCSKSCGSVYQIGENKNRTGFSTVYSFAAGAKDGAFPLGEVLLQGSTLYGTTQYGKLTNCGGLGCGTLYEINKDDGHEKKVFRFCRLPGCADGVFPRSGLSVGPLKFLYGTTTLGGAGDGLLCGSNLGGCGVVYQLTTDGPQPVYSFCSKVRKNLCADGAVPLGGLLDYKGSLYGTTQFGGAHSAGTIFKLTLKGSTWSEKIIYDFCKQASGGVCADGSVPQAGLIQYAGNLYGTTTYGGNACSDNPNGCGTVFGIAADGTGYAVLHSFDGIANSDGASPQAPLVADDAGNLFGTTLRGGGGICTRNGTPQGCGTLFELAAGATYTSLYAFTGGTDGNHPAGALAWVPQTGTLYGAVTDGGDIGGCGCGILYSYALSAGTKARQPRRSIH